MFSVTTELIADGEALAALGAASAKDIPAMAVCHSLAETVLIGSFLSGRLECAFHSSKVILSIPYFSKGCKDD